MRKIRGGYLIVALAIISVFTFSSLASAAVDKVICVPWQGDTSKQHTALSGVAVQLKGVIKTTGTTAVYYKWVFGDGTPDTAPVALSGSTKYNVETTHTYTAASGTPFTAKLQVSNTTPFALSKEDSYLLKIEDNTDDSRINIAIDKGLWWLYKQANSNNPVYGSNYGSWTQTYDGSTAMTWVQTSYLGTLVAPTASAVQAFGINGHKINGNPDEDPYVEAVQYGMNYLTKGYRYYTSWPALNAMAIGILNRGGGVIDDPEAGQTSPNGYGIQVYEGNDHQPYIGGQVMDAIVSVGVAPTALTGRDFAPGTPKSHVWTYGELLQDLADMHAWGQWDGGGCNGGICGSWWYNWNYSSPGDNSASQWPVIGMIPAQEAPWNVIIPSWVKTYNANWLAYSMGCSGPSSSVTSCAYNFFSYNGVGGCAGDNCQQTTTSGMVQMIFDGQTTSDLKWGKGHKFIADQWRSFLHDGSAWGGYRTYGWYSFAKAMRLALPTATTQLAKTSGASFDWYYGDPTTTTCTTEANCEKGLAPRIVEIQAADGSWSGNLTNQPLTTAWMIITLKPTLFASAPIACFSAAPNPSYANQDITFDPTCSGHSEAGKGIGNLTKFEWDWNNDGTYDESTAAPTPVLHQFACASLPCAYPVKLKVTDDSNPVLTAAAVVTINITNPPHPPVANAGGPYTTSFCAADTLALDGSKSADQDEGTHQAGCSACPDDTITAWDWDLKAPLTFDVINKSGKTVTLTAANIASFFTSGSNGIGLKVTDNTALAYPGSGQPNLTNANFGTVDVKNACICNLVARAKLNKIQLTWTAVSGATYDIYRSTEGSNTGFVMIASDVVTTYATYLDEGLTIGKKYYYRVVVKGGSCTGGSNAASAIPTAR